MNWRKAWQQNNRLGAVLRWLGRREVLALMPVAMLIALWTGGEKAMLVVASLAPLIWVLSVRIRPEKPEAARIGAGLAGLGQRSQTISLLNGIMRDSPETGLHTACLVVQLDEAQRLADRFGRATHIELLSRTAERLSAALRNGDVVSHIEHSTFAVILAPQRRLDLETLVQLSARLQAAVGAPVSLQTTKLYLTCSVGFCLSDNAPEQSGRALLEAAQMASEEALRNGPGAIRAWSPDMPGARARRHAIRTALLTALDEGQIRPHFQPQICTNTGRIAGFEALARWYHPDRGLVPPAEFLPAIEEAGLSERLGDAILSQALTALVRWEKTGLKVPIIGVNFSPGELRNPRLVEKLQWELDRFNLTPDRLTIEVLENVVATPENEVIVQNIAALSRIGCGIDLDDFGTGQASITNIRRFAVRRLKIDRSFVSRIDSDRDQQKVVSAILAMADQFGLETVAEGVETAAEHAMLAQLGCSYVQGFGIGHPMNYDQAVEWIEDHRGQLTDLPRIGNKSV